MWHVRIGRLRFMHYTIEEYLINEYNASSKARKDVSYFVLQNGFRSLFKNDKRNMDRYDKIGKILLTIQLCMKLFFLLKKDDILFIQTSKNLLRLILRIKVYKKFKVIYLIHDLYCLKYNTTESIKEHIGEITQDISLLSQCDYVIAHNDSMVQRIKYFGCTSELRSLGIFDYNCSFPERRRKLLEGEKIKVTFAGYLGKADFLSKLDKSVHRNSVLLIYGIPKIPLENAVYKGSVDADVLPNVIEGHFGLIWEGSFDVTTKDNYMCINNPHKLSMYVVAGLPVIVWKSSAIAQFVEVNNIGFTLDSLDELDDKVGQITSEEYSVMVDNCLSIRKKLVQGGYLRDALKSIYTLFL